MPIRYSIKNMQTIARYYGGKCLSKIFTDPYTPLKWMCSEGHTWDAPFSIVRQGGWCVQCLKKKERLLEVQAIAKERGGVCLSTKYIGSESKLRFQCKNGHQWSVIPYNIKTGSWCKKCYHNSRRLSIEQIRDFAKKRGGKCLSNKFESWYSPLKWKCKEGHTWISAYSNLVKDRWCPKCAEIKIKQEVLQSLQKLAKEKGGKCLSEKYINKNTKLKWVCRNNHLWMARPVIIQSGRWCRQCFADKQRGSIEDMQLIAKQRSGRCLSKNYIDNDTKLIWKCREGHKWSATPANISNGTWCRKCVVNSRKLLLPNLMELAVKKGGILLSKKYINTMTKLHWQCAKKHRWWASANDVKHDHWCSKCYHLSRTKNISYA